MIKPSTLTAALVLLLSSFKYYFFNTLISKTRNDQNEFHLKIHFFEESSVYEMFEIRTEDLEMLALLSECFPNDYSFSETANMENVQRVKENLYFHDIGNIIKGNQMVGIMSGTVSNNPSKSFSSISHHNVCIKQEYRNMGLVQKFLPQFTQILLETRIPREHRKDPNYMIYGGLAVNFFENPDALVAFTTYAKIGFDFWWQPCREDILNFDMGSFDARIREIRYENPLALLSPILSQHSNLSGLIQVQDPDNNVNDSLCMIKLAKSNDFYRIGEEVESFWKLKAKPSYGREELKQEGPVDDLQFDAFDF